MLTRIGRAGIVLSLLYLALSSPVAHAQTDSVVMTRKPQTLQNKTCDPTCTFQGTSTGPIEPTDPVATQYGGTGENFSSGTGNLKMIDGVSELGTVEPLAYAEANKPLTCRDGQIIRVLETAELQWCVNGTWQSMRTVNVKSFGARGDVVWAKCSITATQSTLTCPAGTFKVTDVGKTIRVPKAGLGHSVPPAPTVTLQSDSTTGQMTAGGHQYKFTLVYVRDDYAGSGLAETAPSVASSTMTVDGSHTSVKINTNGFANYPCHGRRDCVVVRIYRNSVADPTTFRFLTWLRQSDDYYDTVPDAKLASSAVAPSADASFSPLDTTISAFVSDTQVILASAAITTSTNEVFTQFGTDDTAAIRRAASTLTHGAMLYFPPGRYWHKISPTYNMDTVSGDHNGSGDAVIQVKETVDTELFAPGVSVFIATNGEPAPEYYTIQSVSGNRITITGTLTRDYYEYDYVMVESTNSTMVTLIDLKLGSAALNDVVMWGYGATLAWMPNSGGAVLRKTDAARPKLLGFNFIGNSTVGQPPAQNVWTTGDGIGSVTNGVIRDVFVENAWQLLFWGIQNNGWIVENFVCIKVLACTQGAGAVGDQYAKIGHTERDFAIWGDQVGTDDGIAFFSDSYSIDIGPGFIDKGGSLNPWESSYNGNCITWNDAGSGSSITLRVKIHDIVCRNNGGLLYGSGKPIDPRFINPNKSGIVFSADNGGTLRDLELRNIISEGGYYCFRVVGQTDKIIDARLTSLTARKCVSTGFSLQGHKGLQARDLTISGHAQFIPGHALDIQGMTSMDIDTVHVDGTGGVSGSIGVFVATAIDGSLRHLRIKNVNGTGFWMAGDNPFGGPLILDDIDSSSNATYGYELQGHGATSFPGGLTMRDLKGSGNGTSLYRDNQWHSIDIPDNGNGSTQATYTLNQVTEGHVRLSCNDAQGCLLSLGTTLAYEGLRIVIHGASPYPITMANQGGVPGAVTLNQEYITLSWYQSVEFQFNDNNWHQLGQTREGSRPLYASIGTDTTGTYAIEGWGSDSVDEHGALTGTRTADTSGGNVTYNLPLINSFPHSSANHGRILIFKKSTSDAGTVTVTSPDGTISDFGASAVLSQFQETLAIQAKAGNNWHVLWHTVPTKSISRSYSAGTFCRADSANLTPTRIAANDWGLRRTAAGAETFNIKCDLPVPNRTNSGKGVKLTGFKISQQIGTQALTSNTFNGLATTTYANNTANAVASYGGSIGGACSSMPTATQTQPYLSSCTVGTPAFMNTADAIISLDFTVVMQNGGVYTIYGVTTTWTEQD